MSSSDSTHSRKKSNSIPLVDHVENSLYTFMRIVDGNPTKEELLQAKQALYHALVDRYRYDMRQESYREHVLWETAYLTYWKHPKVGPVTEKAYKEVTGKSLIRPNWTIKFFPKCEQCGDIFTSKEFSSWQDYGEKTGGDKQESCKLCCYCRYLLTVDDLSLRKFRKMSYKEYLKTSHWRQLRWSMLERSLHKCQLCNSGRQLQVHHRTYKNLGCERYEDLIVLCHSCHEKHHDISKEGDEQ